MSAFVLTPLPPFRLDLTVWVLRRLPVNAMDRWDGEAWRRILAIDNTPVEVTARQIGHDLRFELSGATPTVRNKQLVTAALSKLLGLEIDMAPFERLAGSDPGLAELTRPFAGFKPPRMPSVFEAMLNGIACQQISLSAGLQLLNRLCSTFGLRYQGNHAVPRPIDFKGARVEDLRRLGFSGRKAGNILHLARSIVEGSIDLEQLAALSDIDAVAALRRLPGIGRWTAEYVLLRGLGRLDVYPADDVGSQRRMQAWQGLTVRPDYDAIYKIVDRWRPYRGLIYFYLLLGEQARRGWIKPWVGR